MLMHYRMLANILANWLFGSKVVTDQQWIFKLVLAAVIICFLLLLKHIRRLFECVVKNSFFFYFWTDLCGLCLAAFV